MMSSNDDRKKVSSSSFSRRRRRKVSKTRPKRAFEGDDDALVFARHPICDSLFVPALFVTTIYCRDVSTIRRRRRRKRRAVLLLLFSSSTTRVDARVFPGLFPRRVHSLRDPERRENVWDATTQIRSRPSTVRNAALTRARVRRRAPPVSTPPTPRKCNNAIVTIIRAFWRYQFLGRVRRSFSAQRDSGHVICAL